MGRNLCGALGLVSVCLFAPLADAQIPLAQQVSFVGERLNFAPAGGVVSGSLRRFGVASTLAVPLSVEVRPVRGGVVLPSVVVNFAAGAALASYSVTVPAASPGAHSALVLELVEATGVVASGIGRRVIWQQGAAASSGATTRLRAVVFSGASSPSRAVLYDAAAYAGSQPLIVGGIVALGGGGGSAASFQPVSLVPKLEYGTGQWVLPLSPSALLIRGGSVSSSAQ